MIFFVVTLTSGLMTQASPLQVEVGKASLKSYKIFLAPLKYENLGGSQTKLSCERFYSNLKSNLDFSIDIEISGHMAGSDEIEVTCDLVQKSTSLKITRADGMSKFSKKYFLEWPLRKAGEATDDMHQLYTGKRSIFQTELLVVSNKKLGKSKEIFTMHWDGSQVKRRSFHNSLAVSPAWSPGGRYMTYSAYTPHPKLGPKSRNLNLFLYDRKIKKRFLLSYRFGTNSGASFNPKGDKIILTLSKDGSPDLYEISLRGQVLRRLTKGPYGAINVEPHVSPGGDRILFSSDRADSKTMVYEIPYSGGAAKRLTFAGQYNSEPVWSPISKTYAFAGQLQKVFNIYLMDVSTSSLVNVSSAHRQLGSKTGCESPSFSPDGKYLAFVCGPDGKKQVYISDIYSSKLKKVTSDSFNYDAVRWSPYFK